MLNCHNEHRKKHGSPPLKWSAAASNSAQRWADTLKYTGRFMYSPMNIRRLYNVGENLAAISGNFPKSKAVKQACDIWYREISKYDFDNPKFSPYTADFTQMVWSSTTEMGAGIAVSYWPRRTIYIVVHYKPPGNLSGRFQENVPRLV